MPKDPAFLLYSKDFYEGTRTMLPKERACYVDLMIYQHQHEIIPDDLERMLMYCSGIDEATLKATLEAKFKLTSEGWINDVLKIHTENREKFKSNLIISGKIGQLWKRMYKIFSRRDILKIKDCISRQFLEDFVQKNELDDSLIIETIKECLESLDNKGSKGGLNVGSKGDLSIYANANAIVNENNNVLNNKKDAEIFSGKSGAELLSEESTFTFDDMRKFVIFPYSTRIVTNPEFKSVCSEILYERYQKVVNSILSTYPNIRCNFMLTLAEFKKIAALHTDEEIESGLAKLSSSGNIKPESLLHLRIKEYIGYANRDKQGESKKQGKRSEEFD